MNIWTKYETIGLNTKWRGRNDAEGASIVHDELHLWNGAPSSAQYFHSISNAWVQSVAKNWLEYTAAISYSQSKN